MKKAAYPKLWQWSGYLLACLILSGCAGSPPAPTATAKDTLSTITSTQTLKLGYREDSAPFSYKSQSGAPAGYSVELCKRVAESIKSQLKLAKMDIQWVPVTATNRFDMVTKGNVDLECGSTSRTLGREEQVNFSLGTFVEGGSFISLASSPVRRVKDLNGRKVGVIPGTTTDAALKALATKGISPQTVSVTTHTEGIAALREGRIDAYATDRLILMGEAILGQAGNFALAEDYISLEVYGLVMRRDADFRLAVNRALARMYRSGEITSVVQQVFGNRASPSNLLEALFVLNALPE